jgi:hypothetical protein
VGIEPVSEGYEVGEIGGLKREILNWNLCVSKKMMEMHGFRPVIEAIASVTLFSLAVQTK